MSLIFNGTTVDAITYNGTSLTKVIFNGTTVWEWHTVWSGKTYVAVGKSASGVYAYSATSGLLDNKPTRVTGYINNTGYPFTEKQTFSISFGYGYINCSNATNNSSGQLMLSLANTSSSATGNVYITKVEQLY